MADQPPAPNPVLLRPEPLPPFDGEGGFHDAEDFVAEATRRLGDYHLAPGHARDYVSSALRGCARREILNAPADGRATAAQILELVREAFGDKRGLPILLSTFHGRRMGVSEGLLSYSHALAELASRANAHTADSIPEQLLRDRFVEGLFPTELRRNCKTFVRANPAATFLHVKAEAQRWMREDAVEDGAATTSSVHADSTTSALMACVADLTAQVKALQAAAVKEPTPAQPSPAFQPAPPPAPREQWPTADLCWWCQQPGHRMAFCPARRQYQLRRAEQRQRFPPRGPPRFHGPPGPWYHQTGYSTNPFHPPGPVPPYQAYPNQYPSPSQQQGN